MIRPFAAVAAAAMAGSIAAQAGASTGSRQLDRPGASGNLPFAVDFRDFYATVLDRWWGTDAAGALCGRFHPLDLLRA